MATERHINLDPLSGANSRLGEYISLYGSVSDDHPHRDALRTAVVKAFEFTYSLAFNIVRRYLTVFVLSPGDVEQMNNYDSIRTAAKSRLIAAPDQWFDFRDLRNETAHEYFEQIADRVADAAQALHQAVSELVTVLQERLR